MKALKKTFSFDGFASVDTLQINADSVVLEFYQLGTKATLELPTKFYCKRFLKNSVEAFSVGSSVEKILANAERHATEKF